MKTAPVVATSYMTGYELPWGKIMATGTVIVLPVTIFALLVCRHMVRGLTMGATEVGEAGRRLRPMGDAVRSQSLLLCQALGHAGSSGPPWFARISGSTRPAFLRPGRPAWPDDLLDSLADDIRKETAAAGVASQRLRRSGALYFSQMLTPIRAFETSPKIG